MQFEDLCETFLLSCPQAWLNTSSSNLGGAKHDFHVGCTVGEVQVRENGHLEPPACYQTSEHLLDAQITCGNLRVYLKDLTPHVKRWTILCIEVAGEKENSFFIHVKTQANTAPWYDMLVLQMRVLQKISPCEDTKMNQIKKMWQLRVMNCILKWNKPALFHLLWVALVISGVPVPMTIALCILCFI